MQQSHAGGVAVGSFWSWLFVHLSPGAQCVTALSQFSLRFLTAFHWTALCLLGGGDLVLSSLIVTGTVGSMWPVSGHVRDFVWVCVLHAE